MYIANGLSNWHHQSRLILCRCLCVVHVCVSCDHCRDFEGTEFVGVSRMVVDIHTHTLIPPPPHTLTPGLHCTVNSKFLPGLRKPICPSVGWEEEGVGGMKGVPVGWTNLKVPSSSRSTPAQSSAHVRGSSPTLFSFITWRECDEWRLISLILPGFYHAVLIALQHTKMALMMAKAWKGG